MPDNLPDFGQDVGVQAIPDFGGGQQSVTLPDFSSAPQSPVAFYNRTRPKKTREEISKEIDDKSIKTEPEWLYKPLDFVNNSVQAAANLPRDIAHVAINIPRAIENAGAYVMGQEQTPYIGNEPLVRVELAPGYMESGVSPVFKGIVQAASERATQLSTPENALLLALAPESVGGMQAPLAKAFTAPMVESVLEQYPRVKQTVQDANATSVEKATAVAGIGMDALITGLSALGLTHNDIGKYTPEDLQHISQSTSDQRVFQMPDKQFDLEQIAQKVADPKAAKLDADEVTYLGKLAKESPQEHQAYLEKVKGLRTQPVEQTPSLPDFSKEQPLNPGGSLASLPQELQDKSNSVKDAMRAQYEQLKAQAQSAKQEENAPQIEASTSLSEPLLTPAPYADKAQSLNAPEAIPGVKPETYEGGKAVTYTQDNKIRLVNIETDIEQRGKGYAGKFLQSLKEKGLPIELDVAKPELKEFYKKQGFVQGERESTMVWSPELEQKRIQKVSQAPTLRTPEENVQTYGEGRPFVTETEKELNKPEPFGIKPTKEGVVPTTSLLSRMERVTTKEERQGLEEQGFSEWVKSKGQSVSKKEVADWVKENGPKVEVRKFGEGQQSASDKQLNLYQHQLETLVGQNQAEIIMRSGEGEIDNAIKNVSSEKKERAIELWSLYNKELREGARRNTGHANWQSISPKSEKDMNGYIEIAVTKPAKPHPTSGYIQESDIKFPSSHGLPPNTLAWVRGHMEIDPVTKEKTFLIHEVQSDWAQRVREEIAEDKDVNNVDLSPRNKDTSRDPLLQHYESLALKSAIEHARQEGATHIAISDAETAMITEGHDRQAYQPNTIGGRLGMTDIPQEPGMRQHYDVSLPNIAKKLTKHEGEVKEYGEHKMARNTPGIDDEHATPRKDLIFRNPDGTPKTSITARSYPLDKITPRLASKEPMLQTGSKLFLTPDIFGLAKFAKTDLLPLAKRSVDVVKATKDILISLISPTSKAKVPDLDTLFESKGYVEKLMVKATHALTDVKKGFDKMSPQERIDFMDRVKRGQVQPTKELQQVAQLLRGIDDDIYNEVKKYKPSLPYLENHLRAIWEVIPGSKTSKGQNIGSKRPWQGSQGMFKQHTLVDVSEGLKAGGKLITDNPAKLVLLNAQDSLKFIAANRAWEGLKKTGTVQYIKPGKRAPLDYVRINDSISKVYFPTKSGLVKGGEWYVQKDVAKLINNYLSRDYIRENELGKAALDFKMATTAIELSLSPFHAVFETFENISSSFGLGMAKALSGRVLEGTKDFALAVPSAITTARLGGKIKKFAQSEKDFAALDPVAYKWFTIQYPTAKSMIEDAFNAGMKITMHEDYQTNFREGFKKAVQEGNSLGAAVRLIPALNEFPMQALFDNYIPKLKMGMFMREYAFELERRSGDIASGKVSKGQLGRQTWDFVEDRFGEMNFDNLYWNRTAKTSMQLLMRSITWKLGSTRAYAKAFRDLGMEVGVNWWKEGRAPRMTLPMGWLVGQALWTGVLSTIITKSTTGKYPWQLAQNEQELEKNFTFPRIDENDKNQRLSMPTYWRDFASITHSPKEYAKSGLSGEIGRIGDVLENKDFFGVEVRNPNDPVQKQITDSLKHLFPTPFGVANLAKAETKGQAIAGFAGFPKAPSYVSKTPAEQLAGEILSSKTSQGAKTREQFEESTKERQVVKDVRAGKTDLRDAMDAQSIPLHKYAELNAKATMTPLQYSIRHMTIDESIRVYDKGDEKEKEELKDQIRTKIVRNPNLTFDQKEVLFDKLEGKFTPTPTPSQPQTQSPRLPSFD